MRLTCSSSLEHSGVEVADEEAVDRVVAQAVDPLIVVVI